MKTVFIDPITFECHTSQNLDCTRIPYETDRFEGKCDTFIEGHRIVPKGFSWRRWDGKNFAGEMISFCRSYAELAAAQAQYEADLAAAAAAYQEGVNSAYEQ